MQQLLFTLIASTTIIATAFGQESNDSANAIKLTPEQKNLAAFVGTWELSVEGVEKKGTAEIKPILGGRFITEDVKLPFGDFDMEWHGVIGHNEGKKQYTGVWFDNANNTTHSSSGEADESGRIITFRGEQVGFGKFIWRISNDGKSTMTIDMFQVADGGKETPVMKVSGKKQSPSADQRSK
jgi:hypothetical protein